MKLERKRVAEDGQLISDLGPRRKSHAPLRGCIDGGAIDLKTHRKPLILLDFYNNLGGITGWIQRNLSRGRIDLGNASRGLTFQPTDAICFVVMLTDMSKARMRMVRAALSPPGARPTLLPTLLPRLCEGRRGPRCEAGVVAGRAADGARRAAPRTGDAAVTNYNNPTTQAERLATLHNDAIRRRAGVSTLLDHVHDESGGRFAALARQEREAKPSVIGVDPAAQYPRLPSSSSWSAGDPVGVEPLIDATDCGTEFGAAMGEQHEQPIEEVAEDLPASSAPEAQPASVVTEHGAGKPLLELPTKVRDRVLNPNNLLKRRKI